MIQSRAREQRVRTSIEPSIIARIKYDGCGIAITPHHFDVAFAA